MNFLNIKNYHINYMEYFSKLSYSPKMVLRIIVRSCSPFLLSHSQRSPTTLGLIENANRPCFVNLNSYFIFLFIVCQLPL